MVRKLCSILMVTTVCLHTYAQTVIAPKQTKLPDRSVLEAAMFSTLSDSLQKRLRAAGDKQEVQSAYEQFVQNNYGKKELQRIKQGVLFQHDSAKFGKFLDQRLRGFYARTKDLNLSQVMSKNAWNNHFKGISIAVNTTNATGALSPVSAIVSLQDQLVLGNIPFDFEFADLGGQYQQGTDAFNRGLKKFSFNKEAYMERMSGYMNQEFDVKKYLLQDIDVTASIKKYLASNLEEAQQELQKATGLTNPGEIIHTDELIHLDSVQLAKILESHQALYLSPENLASMAPDSAAAKVAAVKKYLARVSALKKAAANGLDAAKALSSQKGINDKLVNTLHAEAGQKKNIAGLLPLNFVQRLFLQARSLNIGNIAGEGGGLTEGLFMSGFQGSFLSGNKFIGLGAGSRNDALDIKNVGLPSSLDPGNFSLQFMQLGIGDPDQAHTHVGVLNANTKQSKQSFDVPRLPQNYFVGSVSEQVSLGQYGVIAAELAKSNTSYSNTAGSNMVDSKAAAMSLMNDFWQTLSVGLNYTGNVRELDMRQRAYISYAGLGYSNPGAPSATKGTIKYGWLLEKKFNKRKISVGLRGDMQRTQTAAIGNNVWNNSRIAADFRMRVRKNLTVSSGISQSVMKLVTDSTRTTGFLNRNVTAGAQWNGRLFSLPNSSNFNLSMQQIEVTPVKSLLLNMNINHSIVINSHVLSVLMMYNRDVKDQAIYGNLLTTEGSWSYLLGKIINCSSGITYMKNTGVVEQIGVKQTISAMVTSKLNVNAYLDCRKNIMNTAENYLFGNVSTQVAIQYQLK